MKQKRLTEEEFKRWWPFDRLDPKRFPKPPKEEKYPTETEEAPI